MVEIKVCFSSCIVTLQGNAEFCMEDLNIVNQNRVSDYVSSNGEVILKEVPNVGQGEDLQISTVLAMSSGVGSNVMLIEVR